MRLSAFLVLSAIPLGELGGQDIRVEGMRTEYLQNPIGIDARTPRLSWRILAERRGTMQTAYEIRVATDTMSLSRAPAWNSGKVASASSIFVPYRGPALRSATRYYWQVRVWDNQGASSACGRSHES